MQCGFCSMLSELFSRALCFKNRRSSTESYYKELGDQDTLKIEDKASDSEDSIANCQSMQHIALSMDADVSSELRNLDSRHAQTGRFLTMHKRRKKRLLTRTLCQQVALLDDLQLCQMQFVLDQSAQWNFNAFILDNISGGRSLPVLCVHLFQLYGLINHFELDVMRVWKLFTLIEEGYHSTNPYHNQVHAVDVTQAMHCFLQQDRIRDHLEPLEVMASLIASIAHDVDHPGVNQPFLIATSNHLASLYQNTSVLENHHWRWAMSCLAESGVIDHLVGARSHFLTQISSLILATDITRQQEFLTRFKDYLDNNSMDLKRAEHRHLVLQIALKCADISNPCRPWEISRKWSLRVCDEFFRQGDYERKLNLPVTALCDRHTTSIPKIQSGFFQFVVTPLVNQWHRFLQNDLSDQMLGNLNYNKTKWDQLLAKEIAEETKTEVSDAELMDDELDSSSMTNVSSSSEMLLPPRRQSLNVAKQAIADDAYRRFSVPLNMFQDGKLRSRDRMMQQTSLAASKAYKVDASLQESEGSLHSQLSLRGHCESGANTAGKEKVLSTEKLLPDTSIASITTPRQATRLNLVIGRGGKILRQQTFPPLEARVALRGYSHDEQMPQQKTDFGQNYLDMTKKGKTILNRLFMKCDKTDNDDASDISECTYNNREKENFMPSTRPPQAGRRDSAPVGSQLRDNLFTFQPSPFTKEQLMHRRKSMPTEVLDEPKEKKMRENWILPNLLNRTMSAREGCAGRRRGSAPPVDVNELRALVGGAIRHSLNGNRRKQKDLQPMAVCQQWFIKATYQIQEKHKSAFQRRGSLPVEVFKGNTSH